jgi:hypothetical protein
MSMDEERLSDEVSRLYWETDVSVGEIAAQLDISRRALYAALRPLPAGERCAECGGELVFMTRSARAEGAAECIACGREQDVAAVGAAAGEREAAAAPDEGAAADAEAVVEGYGAAFGWEPSRRRGVLIAAAALAGVAVGVLGAMRVLRR